MCDVFKDKSEQCAFICTLFMNILSCCHSFFPGGQFCKMTGGEGPIKKQNTYCIYMMK